MNSIAIPLATSALVGLIAVSNDSLWIDEGLSATKAIAPTIGAAWQELRTEGNTNMHMLLYMFCLWAWEKLFGSSEWALRAMNIPFYMLGVSALWFAAARQARPFVLALCLVSPFLWFYLNEARTYSMLFGWSALATAALVYCQREGQSPAFPWRQWTWVLALSCSAMIWTHVVGLFFEAAIFAFLLFTVRPWGLVHIVRRAPMAVAFAILANTALAAYYLWTKSQGVEANPIGRTSLMGILFWIYEFGGFAGLGPGRDELRSGSFAALQSYVAALVLLAIAWSAVAWFGLQRLAKKEAVRAAGLGLFLVLLPLALFMIVGYVEGVRFLPRYAATSYAAFAAVGGILLSSSWYQGAGGKISVGCLLGLLFSSSLVLRFSSEHLKDDYRAATAQAIESLQHGAHVWWAGDIDTARYYGLPDPEDTPRDKRSFETVADLRAAPGKTPDIVYLSKFDIYDPASTIRNLLDEQGYQQRTGPKTFTIWEKPSTTVSP
jgi:hypothetical protein